MIGIEDNHSVIRVKGHGLFDERELASHFEELQAIIRRWRAINKPIRALLDLRRSITQQAQTAETISQQITRIYNGKGDKVAIVVSSALLKMQLRRLAQGLNFAVFETEIEALEFLSQSEPG